MNARGHSPLGTKICLVMSIRQDGLVNMEEIHNTKMELNRMLAVEEDILHQRSRNYWLGSGDHNPSFFHAKALNRHERNTILRIRDSNDR